MTNEFKKRRDYIFEREQNIAMLSALKPEGAFYLFVDVSQTYGKKQRENKYNVQQILHRHYWNKNM